MRITYEINTLQESGRKLIVLRFVELKIGAISMGRPSSSKPRSETPGRYQLGFASLARKLRGWAGRG